MHCLAILFMLGAAYGANPHSSPSQTEIDNAFETLGAHYNDKLCLELLLVDCTKHVTVHDEQVCGTNGKTYPNHCRFTHAVCEYLNAHPPLGLAYTGACVATTASPVTMAPATSGVVATTMVPAAGTTNVASATMTTVATGGVTSAPVASTTMATAVNATTDPLASIIQNVFCQSASTVTCATGLEIKCGSDGQLYPNQCELAKAKCADPTLMIADMSTCING